MSIGKVMEKQEVQMGESGIPKEQMDQSTKSEVQQTHQCRKNHEKLDKQVKGCGSGVGNVSLHRVALCRKRMSHGGVQKVQKMRTRSKFASPTDNLLSPCSQKLNEHRNRLFVAKSKPTKLNFATKRQQVTDEEEF